MDKDIRAVLDSGLFSFICEEAYYDSYGCDICGKAGNIQDVKGYKCHEDSIKDHADGNDRTVEFTICEGCVTKYM